MCDLSHSSHFKGERPGWYYISQAYWRWDDHYHKGLDVKGEVGLNVKGEIVLEIEGEIGLDVKGGQDVKKQVGLDVK